jgi:hypothetical protein
MGIWISMTVQTPLHAQCFSLRNDCHGVNSAVTLHTTDATIDMRGMVEIGIVRQVMYPNPMHRKPGPVALPKWLKILRVLVDLRMAVHACLGWWNIRMRCVLDRIVAVATVHTELSSMHAVTKWYWLSGLVPNIRCLGAKSKGNNKCDVQWDSCSRHYQ